MRDSKMNDGILWPVFLLLIEENVMVLRLHIALFSVFSLIKYVLVTMRNSTLAVETKLI
ncbi:hypothetical protein B0I21_101517 [Sphingobacterium paludis]|uniref:Uncharacterized protein n=1 Tax=Sphingobacterium paludis TaxID=1476465 RepID=A0A4R7DEN7_9SPHI|nr:hypothetical protein B0I21_101517 [Sphingobacterium paludis]